MNPSDGKPLPIAPARPGVRDGWYASPNQGMHRLASRTPDGYTAFTLCWKNLTQPRRIEHLPKYVVPCETCVAIDFRAAGRPTTAVTVVRPIRRSSAVAIVVPPAELAGLDELARFVLQDAGMLAELDFLHAADRTGHCPACKVVMPCSTRLAVDRAKDVRDRVTRSTPDGRHA